MWSKVLESPGRGSNSKLGEERMGCNAANDAGGQRKKTWRLAGPEEVEKEERPAKFFSLDKRVNTEGTKLMSHVT